METFLDFKVSIRIYLCLTNLVVVAGLSSSNRFINLSPFYPLTKLSQTKNFNRRWKRQYEGHFTPRVFL